MTKTILLIPSWPVVRGRRRPERVGVREQKNGAFHSDIGPPGPLILAPVAGRVNYPLRWFRPPSESYAAAYWDFNHFSKTHHRVSWMIYNYSHSFGGPLTPSWTRCALRLSGTYSHTISSLHSYHIPLIWGSNTLAKSIFWCYMCSSETVLKCQPCGQYLICFLHIYIWISEANISTLKFSISENYSLTAF